MRFGAGFRKLHGIVVLASIVMLPVGASASQQVGQGQPAPVQQNQDVRPVQVNRPVIAPQVDGAKVAPPPITTPSITPPQVTAPTVVMPTVPQVAPKPRKKGPVDALKPGQFVWVAQDAYEGPMKIVVVLDIQRIYVFQNDKLIGFSTISSGKKGKETPTGFFTILQKNIDHKSNLYSNAPMPFMQRLTWDGIAMHGGQLPGYPASHGCIRLPLAFAKALYGVTQMNQEVFVLSDTATPVKRPEPKPIVDPVVVPPPVLDSVTTPAVSAPQTTAPFPPEPSKSKSR